MENVFERMRLRRIAIGAGAIGVAAGQASAGIFEVTAGGVRYEEISDNNVYLPGFPVGFGIPPAYGISDAYTANNTYGAFSSFGGIGVNGVAFNPPGGLIDFNTTSEGAFLSTNTPMSISGVDVSLDYFMDASSPTLRVFGTFENTGATGTDIAVTYGGRLKSRTNTQINDSSNGDAIFDQATDRWVLTSGGPGANGNTPAVTLVRFGPNGLAPSSTPAALLTNDPSSSISPGGFADVWDLSLAPGETQSLMMLVNFSPSVADASDIIEFSFGSLSALDRDGLLTGLTNTQIAQTINWNPPVPPPITVPEPGTTSLMGIVLLGVVVTRFMRR